MRSDIEGTVRPLRPVTRSEAYWIAREAVVNAFQHARPSRIEVVSEYAPRHLRVVVRDDGRGSRPSWPERAGRATRAGVRERAETIGAIVRFRSRVSGGTEVELVIAADIAYEPARRCSVGAESDETRSLTEPWP